MSFSIRLSEEERNLAESYARMHSMSVGDAFKKAFFERVEDEYDVAVYREAYDEYVRGGKKSRADCGSLCGVGCVMYRVETTPRFDRDFKKLDRYTQKMLKGWIVKNLLDTENPRQHGKALVGNLAGAWRYRIGEYRLLCHIDDGELIILALTVGHRREIYRQN